MIGYFTNFQKTFYSLDPKDLDVKTVTNILHRSTFLKEVAENTSVFYDYQMKETDTMEIIADKLYGDANRHWIILLFNKIINPFYDVPLPRDALDEFIQNKYNQTLAQSLTTIHHYELRVTKTITLYGRITSQTQDTYIVNQNQVNYQTGALTTRSLPGTADTTLHVSTEQFTMPDGSLVTIDQTVAAVSNNTYEYNENEKRRSIRLLDKSYISRIEDEFSKLMQNG